MNLTLEWLFDSIDLFISLLLYVISVDLEVFLKACLHVVDAASSQIDGCVHSTSCVYCWTAMSALLEIFWIRTPYSLNTILVN